MSCPVRSTRNSAVSILAVRIGSWRPRTLPKWSRTCSHILPAACPAESKSGRHGRHRKADDMGALDKHRDALEVHETMMGSDRGRLAVALDLLTDALAMIGQHGV